MQKPNPAIPKPGTLQLPKVFSIAYRFFRNIVMKFLMCLRRVLELHQPVQLASPTIVELTSILLIHIGGRPLPGLDRPLWISTPFLVLVYNIKDINPPVELG